MGADFISIRTTWPTYADGRPLRDGEDLTVLDARIDALDRDACELMADISSGETLADYGLYQAEEIADEDLDTTSQAACEQIAITSLKARLKTELRDLLINSRTVDLEFDGTRWWAMSGGISHGDSPTEAYDQLRLLDASGIAEAPLDAEEFPDVFALAAAVAVLDDLAATALAALDRAGLPADALAVAAAALEAARDGVAPAGRLIRRTMDALHEQRVGAAYRR